MRRAITIAAITALGLIGGLLDAEAQPGGSRVAVEVTGAPAGSIVEVFVNAGKVADVNVAATGTGTAVLDFVNLGKPRANIQVWVEECKDGRRRLLLVSLDPDGKQLPEEQGCNRRLAGLFWTNRAARVRVDVDAATAQASGFGGGIGFIANIDFAPGWLVDAQQNCEGLEELNEELGLTGSCNVDGSVGGFSVDAGITIARLLVVKVGYLRLGEVTIASTGSRGSFSFRADGHFGPAQGVTFVGGVRVPIGPVVAFGEFGGWRWSAESGSVLVGMNNNQTVGIEELSQENSSTDPLFGGGVEFWFHPNVGISGGLRGVRLDAESSGPEGDVDEWFTVGFVGLKLGWP